MKNTWLCVYWWWTNIDIIFWRPYSVNKGYTFTRNDGPLICCSGVQESYAENGTIICPPLFSSTDAEYDAERHYTEENEPRDHTTNDASAEEKK